MVANLNSCWVKPKCSPHSRTYRFFLNAWIIYVSIQSSYSPERGPGLMSRTERIVFHSQIGFQFSTVLRYAIAYFQKHQQSSADAWYEVDSELVASHFAVAHQRDTATSFTKPSSPSKPKKPLSQQICENHNRE